MHTKLIEINDDTKSNELFAIDNLFNNIFY